MTWSRSVHLIALAAALALAGLGLGACAKHEQGRDGRSAEPAVPAEPGRAQQGLPLRMELAADVRLSPSAQAELAVAVWRFATTLATWLYGDRREIAVEPIGSQLRRELADSPPYVPPDQIGSGDGQALRVQVFAQTSRSGVLVVTIRDSRTGYPIPASFERHAGRWQIVHLNTH